MKSHLKLQCLYCETKFGAFSPGTVLKNLRVFPDVLCLDECIPEHLLDYSGAFFPHYGINF